MDDESRKNAETIKNQRRSEKKYKDLQFQMEEDHKNAERAQEQVDKLNARLKKMKSQLDEAVCSVLRHTTTDTDQVAYVDCSVAIATMKYCFTSLQQISYHIDFNT